MIFFTPNSLRIAGIGYSVPNTVVSNEDLTKLYDTSDEWIYSRTGIKQRRVVSGNQDAIDLGYEAAKNAIEKSGIDLEEIDMYMLNPKSPCIIRDEEDTFTYLILPVNINQNQVR